MPPVEGYWGERTATIDWCEENYVINHFIAEFWNTVSNAIMIFAPMWMMFMASKQNYEKHHLYSFIAVTVVGIGSWLFHMTLRYSMQLMDELPMIWGSMFLIYSLYMVDSQPEERSRPVQILLVLYCSVVSLVYLIIQNPVFHEVAYGVMVAAIVFLGLRIMLKFECSKGLFWLAVITYGLGFLFWNVDNVFCHHLKSLRSSPLGKMSGMLYQCHAWWHIFAGTGTYVSLLFQLHARYLFLKKNPEIKYLLGCWPYISIVEVSRKNQ